MRIVIRKSIVDVIGGIWMPSQAPCAMTYEMRDSEVDALASQPGGITRESVERWVNLHAGDFQSIDDFHASIEVGYGDDALTIAIPWAKPESEAAWADMMYGSEANELEVWP